MVDYPSEEQGIEKNKTEEDKQEEMVKHERDEDIYEPEGRDALMQDAEISPAEEGIMEGASGRGQDASCDECGKLLGDNPDVVTREVDGVVKEFCSEQHAERYAQKRQA